MFSLPLFKKHIKGEKQITDWKVNGTLNYIRKIEKGSKEKKMSFMHYGGAEKQLLASSNIAKFCVELWCSKAGVIEALYRTV